MTDKDIEEFVANGNYKTLGDDFKSDPEFLLRAVKINGMVLEYAVPEICNNREIVLEAVKQNGLALRFASKELKCDKEIVMTAIRQNGRAIACLSDKLKASKRVVLEAMKQDSQCLTYGDKDVAEGIRKDLEEITYFRRGNYKFDDLNIELFLYEVYVEKIKKVIVDRLYDKFGENADANQTIQDALLKEIALYAEKIQAKTAEATKKVCKEIEKYEM